MDVLHVYKLGVLCAGIEKAGHAKRVSHPGNAVGYGVDLRDGCVSEQRPGRAGVLE